jgi:hypothetical protein
MDEARIREILREEIEAVERRQPTLADVHGEKFSDKQKLGLVRQINEALESGKR